MKHDSLLAIALALSGAIASFAQTTVPLNLVPSRIVGHPNQELNSGLASGNPNLVEGRELLSPQGVALDTSVNPPILYVADTGNNRVLAWKDATSFRNGQTADLVIGQQDLYRTLSGGPGTTFSTGLNTPTALAVLNGDLYIADTGNNRVLRFRKPFVNAPNLQPDLWLGQPTINSRAANYTGQTDAKGVFFASGSTGYVPGIAFDGSGNLWITDPGNRRVLRFDAGDVASGGGPLQANLVIGQLTFQDPLQPAVTDTTRTEPRYFAIPEALAFDSSGRLFVSDSYVVNSQQRGRVLVFLPPFSNGMPSSRIMGVVPATPPGPITADAQSRTFMGSPSGIFFLNSASKIGVVDQFYNRILLFDSYEQWPDAGTFFSPISTSIVGQLTVSNIRPNGATDVFVPAPSDSTLYAPSAAAFAGSELYVVDASNHRVLALPFQGGAFGPARAVLGQDAMDMSAANLIEGREFYFSQGGDAGLAIDSSGDTPHLYVADTYNNRVLGFRDYRQLQHGMPADLVIGQADMKHGLCNGNGDPNHPSATSLCLPTGLVVDSAGSLFVADSGNGRVLRFPAPFAHQGSEQADLVLGQRDFKTVITDPTQFTMSRPYGLALSSNDGLLVSDLLLNRVLFFRFTNGGFGPSDSGKAAEKVLGQPDFTTIKSGNGDREMSAPHGIAVDSEGRPYIADTANNRVLIFDQINNDPNGAPAAFKITGLAAPRGVYVSAATGEAWITDTNNNGLVKKYPRFQTLLGGIPTNLPLVQSAAAALTVVQDQYGNLVVADNSNRVGFYFPGLQAVNGANFMTSRDLAPGMFAAICSPGSGCDPAKRINYLGADTASASDLPNPLPLPTTLADLQVVINGSPAPIHYVSPGQINFYVPMSAPSGGTADLQVIQKSTGRIYAAGTVNMNTYSPGIYTLDFGTNRQAAVINSDGTVNSPTNPAARGSYISIYATGQGFVPNAPSDGSPAPSDPLLTTPFTPQVNINGKFPEEYPVSQGDPPAGTFVQFSGLAPGFVGVWQINVFIPGAVPAGSQVPILVFAGSLPSNDFSQTAFRTVIAVKNP